MWFVIEGSLFVGWSLGALLLGFGALMMCSLEEVVWIFDTVEVKRSSKTSMGRPQTKGSMGITSLLRAL